MRPNLPHRAGDVLELYFFFRAFSWQLRLSPFTCEELAAALVAPHPTSLLAEVHV